MSRGLFDKGIAGGRFDGKVRDVHSEIRKSRARFLMDFAVSNEFFSTFFSFLVDKSWKWWFFMDVLCLRKFVLQKRN